MSPIAVVELVNPDELDSSTRRWDISTTTVVGRASSPPGEANISYIVLAAAALSRQHLQLTPRPRGWFATDLGSRNGTHLNGVALDQTPAQLHDGDLLVLAGSVTLRFRDPMATPIVPRIGRLVGVWIDPDTDAVWVDARRVEPPISRRQLQLLKLLDAANGEVVSRAAAIDAAWDDAAAQGVTDDALTALIKRLRKRLAEFETGEPTIEIIRHRGIRLRTNR